VGHLYDRLLASCAVELGTIDPETDGLSEALATLWRTFARPELAAAYELQIAARTDAELRDQLVLVTDENASAIRATARNLFPEFVSDPRFGPFLDTVLEAFQGMAVSRMVVADAAHESRVLEVLQTLARETFQTRSSR
jgi:hypothetical protein